MSTIAIDKLVEKFATSMNSHEAKIEELANSSNATENSSELIKFQMMAQKMQQQSNLLVNTLSNIHECNMTAIRGLKQH